MDELFHYGVGHLNGGHSGRWPYGSGDTPYQHNTDGSFMDSVRELRKAGYSESQIAFALDMKTPEYRAKLSIEKARARQAKIAEIEKYYGKVNPETGKPYTYTEIGEIIGTNESSVRALLKPGAKERADFNTVIAEDLKKQVAEKKFLDVTGSGTELEIGDALGANVSEERLKTAVEMLKDEGYTVHWITVEQATNPGKKTTVKVLAAPGTEYNDVNYHRDEIKPYADYEVADIGKAGAIRPPVSVDSKRIMVNYAETGGTDKDGVIEIRPGVKDLNLNGSAYAQVRVAVDDSHYLKGMAMYGDPKMFPPGVDIIFNTNKSSSVPMLGPKDNSVLKPLKDDPDNPFGATIKMRGGQWDYEGDDGQMHQSPINKVNDEGDWDAWSRTLSSQMLSKQPLKLINKQLDLTYEQRLSEFEEIKRLDNPTVRKKMLEEFAGDCDSSAVDLKATGLPGQTAKVILPITNMDPKYCYCPSLPNGTKVVLIRHPHEGVFQIPELTVNNNNPLAESLFGSSQDAIGISPRAAQVMSGADFDGDTVIVIPNTGSVKVQSRNAIKGLESSPLKELETFDPSSTYPAYEGMPRVKDGTNFNKQQEMGKASNLISDMQLKGAKPEEITRAVKYSMTVIDADKHNLDWKGAFVDNQIAALKKNYQGGENRGASTLISRAKKKIDVPERKEFSIRQDTDPETGERRYRLTDNPKWKLTGTETAYDKNGKEYTKNNYELDIDKKTGEPKIKTQKVAWMDAAKDARELISDADTAQERAYANYANRMKALANEARKEYLATPSLKQNKEAKEMYSEEVESLKTKLALAKKNAPRERQAQLATDVKIKAKIADNPEMKEDEIKKAKAQILAQERVRYGAKRQAVNFTDKEWEAVQKGAVSENTFMQLLTYADADKVRKLATPRASVSVNSAKESRIRTLKANGATLAEIAEATGLSTSTVSKVLRGVDVNG